MVEATFEGVAVRWRCLLALLPLLIAGARTDHAAPRLQAGVLADGFAILHGRQVRFVDRAGGARGEVTLAFDADTRIAGASGGIAVGWRDGNKVKLATIVGDELRELSTWGTNVKTLCEGVATNEQRFGVGWLETDGRVWVVHGPTATALAATTPADASLAAPSWCGVASADDKIVLLWRDGDRVYMNACSKRSCASIAPKVPIERKAELVGFGCANNACLFAQRTAKGTTLVLSSDTGRAKWTKRLDGVTGERVAIVGAGDRALAVAFETTDGGAEVRRFGVKDGAVTSVWRDRAAHGLPAVAWADGKLLVAHRHGDALAPQIVNLPR